MDKGHAEAKKLQEYYRQSRGQISAEMIEVFQGLENDVEGWVGPKLEFDQLLAAGDKLDISLTMCSGNCLKLEKSTKKGSPGAVISCLDCLRSFHVNCMVNEGLLEKGRNQTTFYCESCGGTLDSNKLVSTQDKGSQSEGGRSMNRKAASSNGPKKQNIINK